MPDKVYKYASLPDEPAPPANNDVREVAGTAARVSGGLLPLVIRLGSGIAATPLATVPFVGPVAAGLLGGAGEAGAQMIEQGSTDLSKLNKKRIGVEAALSAVPFGKVVSAGRAAAKGASMALAGVSGRKATSEDETERSTAFNPLKWSGLDYAQVIGGGGLGYGVGRMASGGNKAVAPIVKAAPKRLTIEDFLKSKTWTPEEIEATALRADAMNDKGIAHDLRVAATNTGTGNPSISREVIKANEAGVKVNKNAFDAQIKADALLAKEAKEAAAKTKSEEVIEKRLESLGPNAKKDVVVTRSATAEDVKGGKITATERLSRKKSPKGAKGLGADNKMPSKLSVTEEPAFGGSGEVKPTYRISPDVPPVKTAEPFNPPKIVPAKMPEASKAAESAPPVVSPAVPDPTTTVPRMGQAASYAPKPSTRSPAPPELAARETAFKAAREKALADPKVTPETIEQFKLAGKSLQREFADFYRGAKAAAVPEVSPQAGLRVAPEQAVVPPAPILPASGPRPFPEVQADLDALQKRLEALDHVADPAKRAQLFDEIGDAKDKLTSEYLDASHAARIASTAAEGSKIAPTVAPKATKAPKKASKKVEPLKETPPTILSDAVGPPQLAKNDKKGVISAVKNFIKGEEGSVDPALAMKLGMTAGGAAAGAAYNDEDRLKGAILGGAAGYLGPKVIRGHSSLPPGEFTKHLGRVIPNIYRSALLSEPVGLGINTILAPYGAGILGSIERAVSGAAAKDPAAVQEGVGGIRNLLNPVAHPKRFWNASTEAKTALEGVNERGEQLMGEVPSWWEKVIAFPSTAMYTGDLATRKALLQAGMSDEMARAVTLTANPKTALGTTIVNYTKGHPSAAFLQPFSRTAVNVVESGLERTPGLGILWNMVRNTKDRQALTVMATQQGLGAATGALGYYIGANIDPETAKHYQLGKLLSNMGGQYSAVIGMGFAAGQAAQVGKTGVQQIGAAVNSGVSEVPVPDTGGIVDTIMSVVKETGGETAHPTKTHWPEQHLPKAFTPGFLRDPVLDAFQDKFSSPSRYQYQPLQD